MDAILVQFKSKTVLLTLISRSTKIGDRCVTSPNERDAIDRCKNLQIAKRLRTLFGLLLVESGRLEESDNLRVAECLFML